MEYCKYAEVAGVNKGRFKQFIECTSGFKSNYCRCPEDALKNEEGEHCCYIDNFQESTKETIVGNKNPLHSQILLYFYQTDSLTVRVPNEDTMLGSYTVCPKEVAQAAYKSKIGQTIDFCGAIMKVKDVRITEEYIFIDLEKEIVK